jgi:hypothetical protein
MRIPWIAVVAGSLAAAACNQPQPTDANQAQPKIVVRSREQIRLHQLDALNLAIGLKRAIYDAGYACQRVTDAGFVGTYKNLEMWEARCSEGRDWAIFAGPDGSAQVRDCKDVGRDGLPACVIKQRPKAAG